MQIIEQYDQILADWWYERRSQTFKINIMTIGSLWRFAREFQHVFPQGKTRGGRRMGIDGMVADYFVDMKQETERHSQKNGNWRANLQTAVKRYIEWNKNPPDCLPQAKEELYQFLLYANQKLYGGEQKPQVGSLMDPSLNAME